MAAGIIIRETTAGLGGAATVTELSDTAMNNLFDNVSFIEAASGDVEYRAIDLYNNGDTTAIDVQAFMLTATSSDDTALSFGLSVVHIDSTLSIGDESTAPANVSFADYTSGSPLDIDSIPAGSWARVWIRRTVGAGAINSAEDLGTFACSFA